MRFLLLLILSFSFNSPALVDKLLFTVDGKPFLLSDYITYLELKEMKKITRPPSSYEKLRDFIDFIVMSEEASKRGYFVTDADIDRDISMIAMKVGVDKDSLLEVIHKRFAIPPEKFRDMRKRYLLVNYLLSPYLKNVKIDQDEIEAYYRQHLEDFSRKKARILLITTEKKIIPPKELSLSKLKSFFPDASTTVMEISKGEFMVSLEKKIFSSRKGQIVGPVKYGKGFNYVYLLQDPSIYPESIDKVRGKIIKILQEEKQERIIKKLMDEISATHYVEKCFSINEDEVDFNQRGSCGSWR